MSAYKQKNIKRDIFRTKKFDLSLYISHISTVEFEKNYNVSGYGSLYLSMPYDGNVSKDLFKYRSFTINKKNQRGTLRTFERVLEWFESGNYKDIFLRDENNNLVFNTQYNDLYTVTDKGYFEDEVLRFRPALIEVGENKYVEGVYMFINRTENIVKLTLDEFIQLYDTINGFNFPAEMALTLSMLNHSVNSGTFITAEEYRKQREILGYTK